MALREFVDQDGKRWQVWRVQPTAVVGTYAGPEQRQRQAEEYGPERRRGRTARRLLTPDLDGGWLCFLSEQEKRRLTPVPADWARCPEAVLEAYCRTARPVTAPLSLHS